MPASIPQYPPFFTINAVLLSSIKGVFLKLVICNLIARKGQMVVKVPVSLLKITLPYKYSREIKMYYPNLEILGSF